MFSIRCFNCSDAKNDRRFELIQDYLQCIRIINENQEIDNI